MRARHVLLSLLPARWLWRVIGSLAGVYLGATVVCAKHRLMGNVGGLDKSDLFLAATVWTGFIVAWELARGRAWLALSATAPSVLVCISWPVYRVAEVFDILEVALAEGMAQRGAAWRTRPVDSGLYSNLVRFACDGKRSVWGGAVRESGFRGAGRVLLPRPVRRCVSVILRTIGEAAATGGLQAFAIRMLRRGVAVDAGDAECWEALARLYKGEQEFARAIECYGNLARAGFAYEAVSHLAWAPCR